MVKTRQVSGMTGSAKKKAVPQKTAASSGLKNATASKGMPAGSAKTRSVSKKTISVPLKKAPVKTGLPTKKPARRTPAKKTPVTGVKRYRCRICGYVYSPLRGEPHNGIPAGTAFDDLPDTYVCPVCGYQKRGKIGKWGFDEWRPTRYVCSICGYIYDEKRGEPYRGIKPGTKFEDLPDDYVCPVCALDPRIDVQFGKIHKQGFEPLNDS